ncbi:MAG: hypothetical protein AAGL98_01360 [Planctomycetota bacterium]
MRLLRLFGDRAPYRHVQHYGDQPSQAWMQQEQERLVDIAVDLGIDTKINRHEGSIELLFNDVKDAGMFRLRAYGNDHNPGRHVHRETFEPGDDAYRDAWIAHAREAIDQMGLACRIEQDGDQVNFRFDTNGDVSLFTEMRDRGVFHHNALIDIGGPTAEP